jgi:hypothetical protein
LFVNVLSFRRVRCSSDRNLIPDQVKLPKFGRNRRGKAVEDGWGGVTERKYFSALRLLVAAELVALLFGEAQLNSCRMEFTGKV